MGTKIKKVFNILTLILSAYFILYYGSLLGVTFLFEGKYKLKEVIFFAVSAYTFYITFKELFIIKWKQKEVLTDGANQPQ